VSRGPDREAALRVEESDIVAWRLENLAGKVCKLKFRRKLWAIQGLDLNKPWLRSKKNRQHIFSNGRHLGSFAFQVYRRSGLAGLRVLEGMGLDVAAHRSGNGNLLSNLLRAEGWGGEALAARARALELLEAWPMLSEGRDGRTGQALADRLFDAGPFHVAMMFDEPLARAWVDAMGPRFRAEWLGSAWDGFFATSMWRGGEKLAAAKFLASRGARFGRGGQAPGYWMDPGYAQAVPRIGFGFDAGVFAECLACAAACEERQALLDSSRDSRLAVSTSKRM
jgi:hypothetical protein